MVDQKSKILKPDTDQPKQQPPPPEVRHTADLSTRSDPDPAELSEHVDELGDSDAVRGTVSGVNR